MGADGIEPFFPFLLSEGTFPGPLAARDIKHHDLHLMSLAVAGRSLRGGLRVLEVSRVSGTSRMT